MRVGIAPDPGLYHVADTVQMKQGIQRVELAHQANYHERLRIRVVSLRQRDSLRLLLKR